MKVITVISDESHTGFFLLKLSCALNELELVALVTGGKFISNRLKDRVLLEYLLGVDPQELVLFSDGYDALFLAGEDEIFNKYQAFEKPIVFSCETNCWPDVSLARSFDSLSTGPYRYLNSGGFIGRAGTISSMISKLFFDDPNFEKSNQYTWSQAYFSNRPNIALDHQCSIFCTFSPEIGRDFLPPPGERDYGRYYRHMRMWFTNSFEISGGRLRVKQTGSRPCHLHFNGDSKVLIDSSLHDLLIELASKSFRGETLYASQG